MARRWAMRQRRPSTSWLVRAPVCRCGVFCCLSQGRAPRSRSSHVDMKGQQPNMPIKPKHASSSNARLSRRAVLKGSATAAILAAAKTALPFGAHVAWAAGPETTSAKLGYIALMDASPLIIAKEKGLFARHGMPDVEVLKQASWGATRDNIVLGGAGSGIDGAHILTPMPYLISAGKVTQNNVPTPMAILARLNLDAQAISVANEYKDLKVGA